MPCWLCFFLCRGWGRSREEKGEGARALTWPLLRNCAIELAKLGFSATMSTLTPIAVLCRLPYCALGSPQASMRAPMLPCQAWWHCCCSCSPLDWKRW